MKIILSGATAFAMRLLLGEMASIALVSIRMRPQVLLNLNYPFKYRDIESYFKSGLH